MKQTGKSKFYDFVPIAPLCKRNRGISYQTFNIQNYNGKLVLEIKVLSPLHIGTGKVILDKKMKEDTMKFVANSQGKIVPGSSLKGVVRTVAEAVSFSCAPKIPRKLKSSGSFPKNNAKPCYSYENQCPACSVFGMMSNNKGYKGKVLFRDFQLMKGQTGTRFFPNTFGKKDKNYWDQYLEPSLNIKSAKKRIKGRKFYFSRRPEDTFVMQMGRKKGTTREVVLPGAIFQGEIIFQNMTEEEMGLLLYSPDIGYNFIMKLGYGKCLGCGKVQMDLLEVQPRETGITLEKDIRQRYTVENMKELAVKYRKEALEKDGLKQIVSKFEEIMGDNG